ncbi:hypothetical protein V8E54_014233 [Elaphomyces granulatus]
MVSAFWKQGRWTEAEKLDVQVMEARKTVLGPKHPDTLTSMHNLASTYRKQGRWTEAEKLDVQVMETSKTVLGREHPDTLSSISNLAYGMSSATEKLGVQVMETRKTVLGPEHPDTLMSMWNLSYTLKGTGSMCRGFISASRLCSTPRTTIGSILILCLLQPI